MIGDVCSKTYTVRVLISQTRCRFSLCNECSFPIKQAILFSNSNANRLFMHPYKYDK